MAKELTTSEKLAIIEQSIQSLPGDKRNLSKMGLTDEDLVLMEGALKKAKDILNKAGGITETAEPEVSKPAGEKTEKEIWQDYVSVCEDMISVSDDDEAKAWKEAKQIALDMVSISE
jgi:hypothetical protein